MRPPPFAEMPPTAVKVAPEEASGKEAVADGQLTEKEGKSDEGRSAPAESDSLREGGDGSPNGREEGRGWETRGEGRGEDVVGTVTQRAHEISRNVADFASVAGHEAAAVVHGLNETVAGFSSGFVSLFSVFDTPHPADARTAGSSSSSGGSSSSRPAGQQSKGVRGGSKPAGGTEEESGRRIASRSIDLQAIFGLPPEESLLEAFPCQLAQTYRCTHNAFTPEIRNSFASTLYITDQHVCVFVDDGDRRIPIRVKVSEVGSVTRIKGKKGSDFRLEQLKINLSTPPSSSSSSLSSSTQTAASEASGQNAPPSPSPPSSSSFSVSSSWIVLQDFPSLQDLESALALLEHLANQD